MKKLVRGSVLMLVLSMFVAIVYAQSKTTAPTIIANDSQPKIENTISDSLLTNNNNQQLVNNNLVSDNVKTAEPAKVSADEKELVKKTAMVKAAGAGRGAFSATAYCLRGRTAMGHGVRRGIIAADPRVLRLGSTVTINAGPWSGSYLVSDSGGRIKGKKLDIWVPSCSEARKFGRRTVQVN
jgi:3D (Asp-Asp-Asp) domain-containing protein